MTSLALPQHMNGYALHCGYDNDRIQRAYFIHQDRDNPLRFVLGMSAPYPEQLRDFLNSYQRPIGYAIKSEMSLNKAFGKLVQQILPFRRDKTPFEIFSKDVLTMATVVSCDPQNLFVTPLECVIDTEVVVHKCGKAEIQDALKKPESDIAAFDAFSKVFGPVKDKFFNRDSMPPAFAHVEKFCRDLYRLKRKQPSNDNQKQNMQLPYALGGRKLSSIDVAQYHLPEHPQKKFPHTPNMMNRHVTTALSIAATRSAIKRDIPVLFEDYGTGILSVNPTKPHETVSLMRQFDHMKQAVNAFQIVSTLHEKDDKNYAFTKSELIDIQNAVNFARLKGTLRFDA